MREAELSPTCEYPLSRLPPVFLNRCGWVSYRFGVGFLSDTYPVVSDVSIVYPDVSYFPFSSFGRRYMYLVIYYE